MCIHRSCLWSIYRFTFETKKKVTSVVRGTVYTKCVYILPVSGVSADLTSKKIKGYWCWKRNGVYIVPVSGVDAELPFQLKKGYWPCKRIGVYKVCPDRSFY